MATSSITGSTNRRRSGQQDANEIARYLQPERRKRWLARLAYLNADVEASQTISIETLKIWYQRYQLADLNGMLMDQAVLAEVLSDQVGYHWSIAQLTYWSSKIIVWNGHCNYCTALFERWPSVVSDEQSFVTVGCYSTSQIEIAAGQGCQSCAFWYSRLYTSTIWPLFKKIEHRLHRLGNELSHIGLSILTWAEQVEESQSQLIWMTLPGKIVSNRNSGCAMSTMFESNVLPAIAQRYDTPDKYRLTKWWMSNCDRQHQHCRAGTSCRPSRLLRISQGKIRVEATHEWVDVPSYATVSYCWGRRKFLMLTSASVSQLSRGIDWDTLPVAFQNAITIARRLQLDYIWIDALCIMQGAGNTQDWLAELALMKDIYRGADINIAFTSATDVFQDSLALASDYSGGFIAKVLSNDCCRKLSFHPCSPYEEAITEQHLATRAWTFQERLLARRTISIGETGWFWECRAHIASEYLPEGYVDINPPQLSKPVHQAWLWGDIVSIYSQADMTKSGDKLPALSGIARAQHDIVQDTYLAGMWKTNFSAQLAWICTDPKARPLQRAPSWSWTSVDGKIDYWKQVDIEPIKRHYAEIQDVSIDLAGTDPFGPIRGGRLLLSCKLFSARLTALSELNNEDWKTGRVAIDQVEYHILLDCTNGDDLLLGEEIFLVPLHGFEGAIELDRRQGTDFEAIETAQLVRGLVLRQIDPDKYTRIGAFRFSSLMSVYTDHPRTAEFYRSFVTAMRGLQMDVSVQLDLSLPEACVAPEQLITVV